MIVPRHWAEARLRHRDARRQVTVRRFGWSNESSAHAQQLADERAQQALHRLLGGAVIDRREAKMAYNGAEGVPIREEILAEHGDVVLTRNSYGAVCLNTPDVLFADVDFDRPMPGLHLVLQVLLGSLVGGCAGWLGLGGIGTAVLGALLAALLTPMAAAWRRRRRPPERAVADALLRVAEFVGTAPRWRVRVYRTAAGLRLLAMHATFRPEPEAVAPFFFAVGADLVYAKMCFRQGCFRARLTPKPWRIGIGHLRPRPGVWPIAVDRMPARRQWVEDYDRASVGFAACRYLETFGSDVVDPKCEAVRVLHDASCRADSDLPLA